MDKWDCYLNDGGEYFQDLFDRTGCCHHIEGKGSEEGLECDIESSSKCGKFECLHEFLGILSGRQNLLQECLVHLLCCIEGSGCSRK